MLNFNSGKGGSSNFKDLLTGVRSFQTESSNLSCKNLGVFQRPLTLILPKMYRDTNGRRIVIQIGGVYSTFCQEEGILLPKYRDRNGRSIAILFESIGVGGRLDSPARIRNPAGLVWHGKRSKAGNGEKNGNRNGKRPQAGQGKNGPKMEN